MLKEEVINGIILDYKNGLSLTEIVKKWSLNNKCLIYPYLKKFKIPKRKNINFYAKWEIEQIKDLYKAGISLEEIAKKFNVTKNAIYQVLKRRDIKFHLKRILTDKNIEDITKEYLNGSSANQLAKKYHVSLGTIIYWLKKNRVKIRNDKIAKKLKRKRIKFQNRITKNKAMLLGILLADGSEAKGGNVILNTHDNFLAQFTLHLVDKIYGIKGKYSGKNGKIYFLSQNMLEDIHKHIPTVVHKPGVKTFIPEIIINTSTLSKMFLKGYFSCDCAVILTVEKDGTLRREVSLDCYNSHLLDGIGRMLKNLKINFSIYKNQTISIHSEKEFIKFREKIGILPVCIKKGKYWNGLRKDKILELITKTYSKEFKRKFASQEEGYEYLKQQYQRLCA